MSKEDEYDKIDLNRMYMGAVKIGTKGQIVIPKEVRDIFGLKPGDSLLLLADRERGIGLQRYEMLRDIMDHAFSDYGVKLPPIPTTESDDE